MTQYECSENRVRIVDPTYELDVVREGTLESTPRQGCFQLCFPSGTVATERWYVDGLLWGRAVDFFLIGAPKTEFGYKKGLLHGPFRSYLPNGKLLALGAYCDGVAHGQFVLCERGEIVRSVWFDRGKRSGGDAGFTEDGYLLFLDMWQKGKKLETGFIDCIERYLEAEIVPR